MLIAIPTGVKVYNWVATMFRGRIRISTPIVYATGFLILFVIGGLSGVVLANPTIDFQIHNTLFLVAHFHNVIIPGVLFGLLAGYHYWFPKAMGFRLNEKWGITAAVLWIVGFMFTFLPLYALGLLGMPRRTASFFNPAYKPYVAVAFFGALIILSAFASLVIQLYVSIRDREKLKVPVGDPWNGFSLEWSIPSPAPEYNFAILPKVNARDIFAVEKEKGSGYPIPEKYEDIILPRNTSIGMVFCIGGAALGFGLIWHIWWLAILSLAFIAIPFTVRSFLTETEKIIPAEEIAKEHQVWLQKVKQSSAIARDQEMGSANDGLAILEIPKAVS